jgi:hypothetical protein
MNIPPDIHCDQCGWVIVCPHTGQHSSAPAPAGRREYITARGAGRCTECSFHVQTQGHREGCSGTAPVQADKPATDSRTFLQRVDERHAKESNGRLPRPQRRTGEVGDIAQPGTNPAYVRAAIRTDLGRLAAAHEGVRNGTLHAVACNVFEFVKAGHANGPAARAELERIATAIGLPHHEIQSTLRSTWQRVGPRSVPAPAGAAPAYVLESPTP